MYGAGREREPLMTLVQELPTVVGQAPVPSSSTEAPRSRRVETLGVFGFSFAAYLTVAMVLDFHYLSFAGDAVSRMANGFYMLHSRDPHLAAVGFVWNPLSSVADLPLLLFNSWFPVLPPQRRWDRNCCAGRLPGPLARFLLREGEME